MKGPRSRPFADRRMSLFLLQVSVQHLDELIRSKEPLAPDGVELRGRLGGNDCLQLPALLDLAGYVAGTRGEHVAIRLQVGLGRQRPVPWDALGLVARQLQDAVRSAEDPRD